MTRRSLLPVLPPELLYGSLWDAVWLAVLGRLRRGRPYVLAWMNEADFTADGRDDDVRHLLSLPRMWDDTEQGVRPTRYVGLDDASPYIPESEDGGLTFLPHPPPSNLPPWPEFITKLDGVNASICDEFIVIKTVDPLLLDFIDGLPKLQDSRWEEFVEWRRCNQS